VPQVVRERSSPLACTGCQGELS